MFRILLVFVACITFELSAFDFSQYYPITFNNVTNGQTVFDGHMWSEGLPPLSYTVFGNAAWGTADYGTELKCLQHLAWGLFAWHAYNAMQRDFIMNQLTDLKSTIQSLDLSIMVDPETGEPSTSSGNFPSLELVNSITIAPELCPVGVTAESWHLRYLVLQQDELLTWSKVQALAVCGIMAGMILFTVVLGIQLKRPL